MWLGQSWFHRKEHFYRALLESLAYEYATALDVMRENYPEVSFDEIRVIGGGARSDLWNQIKADVMGIRYVRLARDDYAMLGDILLAGSVVGIFADPGIEAARFAQISRDMGARRAEDRALRPLRGDLPRPVRPGEGPVRDPAENTAVRRERARHEWTRDESSPPSSARQPDRVPTFEWFIDKKVTRALVGNGRPPGGRRMRWTSTG